MSETAPPLVLHHPTIRPDWLAKGEAEEIIDPALPIIDPHHHLWDRGGTYFLDELLADTGSGHNVVATVFAQCFWAYRTEGPEAMRPVGETEFAVSVAEAAERRGAKTRACAGIIGFADLNLGDDVAPVLEAHIQAGRGRFRGIRHLTAREETFWAGINPPPPAGMMGSPAFRAGFARLQPLGLSFDAWLYFTQIGEVAALARDFPGTPIVLDHVGGVLGIGRYADQRDEVFQRWRASIRELAQCPNVSVKLGGLGMLIAGFGFHEHPRPPTSQELANAWRPYIETCIEAFGPGRCMFESNFPVDKAMLSYAALWNGFKRIVQGASAEDKRALFHDTAAKVYRIE